MMCGIFTGGTKAQIPQTNGTSSVLFVAQHVNINCLFQTPFHFCTCELKFIIGKVPSFPWGSHISHILFQKESLLDQMHLYIFLWVFKTSYKTSFIVYLQTERTQYTKFYFCFPVYSTVSQWVLTFWFPTFILSLSQIHIILSHASFQMFREYPVYPIACLHYWS